MNSVTVYVNWDGDAIGQRVGRARLTDDVETVRRTDQAIGRGNEAFRSWALGAGGSVVEIGGDEGAVEVPARALADLEAIRHVYETAVGATVSVGVGRKLSEAAKALMAAKLRGKARTVIFDQGVETEVAEAAKNPKTEAEKIGDEYLKKDEPPHAGRSEPKAPAYDHKEHSEGAEAEKAAGKDPKKDYETHFRAAADHQDAHDRIKAVQNSSDLAQLREQTAGALSAIKTQLPVLAQLKDAYPDTYQSVLGLVQAVIALGRGIQDADQSLNKAERQFRRGEMMDPRFSDEGLDGITADGIMKDEVPEGIDPDCLEVGAAFENQSLDNEDDARAAALANLIEDSHYYDHLIEEPEEADKEPHPLGVGLEKAIESIKPGPPKQSGLPQHFETKPTFHKAFDYSHVLPQSARDAGVGLEVHHYGFKTWNGTEKQRLLARAVGPRNQEVGTVEGIIKPKDDGELEEERRARSHVDGAWAETRGQLVRNGPARLSRIYVNDPAERDRQIAWHAGSVRSNVQAINRDLAAPHFSDLRRQYLQELGVPETDWEQPPKGQTGSNQDSSQVIEPHSGLDANYRGQGIGSAMYEALYAHAKNVVGIHHVRGGIHSRDADALHKRLAAKHGFEYVSEKDPKDIGKYPYQPYSYALKSEIDGLHESAYIGPGKGVVFEKEETEPDQAQPNPSVLDKAAIPSHRDLVLPAGTQHNGEIKVTHADGKTSWKSVRSGMIQGQESDAPMMGANSHPVSSREPGSK